MRVDDSGPLRSPPTEARAYELLEQLRWGNDGPTECPHCGSTKGAWYLKPKDPAGRKSKGGSKSRSSRRVWKCRETSCRRQFSVLNNTVMHGTKMPVQTWVSVVIELCSNPSGASAREIAAQWGISERSAWTMLNRLKDALAHPERAGADLSSNAPIWLEIATTPVDRAAKRAAEKKIKQHDEAAAIAAAARVKHDVQRALSEVDLVEERPRPRPPRNQPVKAPEALLSPPSVAARDDLSEEVKLDVQRALVEAFQEPLAVPQQATAPRVQTWQELPVAAPPQQSTTGRSEATGRDKKRPVAKRRLVKKPVPVPPTTTGSPTPTAAEPAAPTDAETQPEQAVKEPAQASKPKTDTAVENQRAAVVAPVADRSVEDGERHRLTDANDTPTAPTEPVVARSSIGQIALGLEAPEAATAPTRHDPISTPESAAELGVGWLVDAVDADVVIENPAAPNPALVAPDDAVSNALLASEVHPDDYEPALAGTATTILLDGSTEATVILDDDEQFSASVDGRSSA